MNAAEPTVLRVCLNDQGVSVRVRRIYPLAGEVRFRDGSTRPKGTLVAVVSLVGRPKLETVVPLDTLRPVAS